MAPGEPEDPPIGVNIGRDGGSGQQPASEVPVSTMGAMVPDVAPVRRPPAAVLRRTRGPRRRHAVPGERHPRPRHPAGAAGGGRRALLPLRRPRRSTTRTASCSRPCATTSPAPASNCPSTGATATGTPTSPTPSRQMRDDGVTPGRLLRHQRLLVVLRLPAVPRGPRGRRRRRSTGAPRLTSCAHYFDHPGFVEPLVDATLAALATSPSVRDGARLRLRHPLHPRRR